MGKTAPVTFYKNGRAFHLRKDFVEDDRFPFKDKEKLRGTFDPEEKILIIEKVVQDKDNNQPKNKDKRNITRGV